LKNDPKWNSLGFIAEDEIYSAIKHQYMGFVSIKMEEKLIQFIREYLPLWMQNGIRDAFKK
jgi:hypothetical protein